MITATERTLVTPELAMQLLSKMVRNRKISPKWLAKYQKNMREGTFDCYSPIYINVNGELADGQHRLQAIVDTGIPQWLYIFTEAPVDAVYDKGKGRSDMESIYMRNIVDETYTGKAIGSLIRSYVSTKYGCPYVLTEDQIGSFIQDYPDAISEAVRISRLRQGKGLKFAERAPVQAVFFAAVLDDVSIYRMEEFASCLNSGEYNGNKDIAAIRLRNMIINRMFPGGGNYTAVWAAAIEHALSDFIHEVPRGKIYKVLSIEEASKPSEHIFITPCPAVVREAKNVKEDIG